MKWYAKLYTRLVFIFLYLPIIVLIAFSFNESKSRASWTGFSFHWYKELFHNELILSSLRNTLIIALAASVIALVLGTMAAVGIYAMRRKWFKSLVMNITYLPILNPEIVTGVSMLLLFVSFGNGIQKFNNWIGGTALSFLQLPEMQLGFVTLIIAHVTFCTPYVILNVLPKLRQMDRFTFEAAQDLGCSPKLAFYKVVIPEIMPGMVSGFLMAFTYSLDDFVISYFVSSASSQTLPVTIFSMVRKRVSPEINALTAIIFVVALALQCFVIYQVLLFVFTRLNPIKFVKKFLPVMGFAFSTATSNATIPMSIDTLNKKMGVSKQISSFTIPLGATINMDGTSIMQGVAVIFIAEAYGIHLTPANLATVVVTATLASIGTAGIPSVGLVTLAMVLNSVGLPTEGIALIMGIDRILDMLRTAVNITGDAVCTTIVSHQEKALNREVFNRD